MLSNMWQYVSGVLGALLVMLGIYTYMTVSGLKLEVVEGQVAMVVAKTDYNMCKSAVDKQNEAIEVIIVDYRNSIKELEKWKEKPAEIRYNTIYKYIPREVITNGDSCENTKVYLDAVRTIDFDGL